MVTQYAPAPLLPRWVPIAQAPCVPPSRCTVAVLSHAEYVPMLTAAAALHVRAALSKAAWWPWPSLSLYGMTRVPFRTSLLRPALWAVPMCKSQGGAIYINVALLPLIGHVWMYIVLPSSRMDSSAPLVGRPDWVIREAGHVGLIGREWGRREYWVTLCLHYLYCLA